MVKKENKNRPPTKKELEEFNKWLKETSRIGKERAKKLFTLEERERMLDAMLKGARRAKSEMKVAYKELEKELKAAKTKKERERIKEEFRKKYFWRI